MTPGASTQVIPAGNAARIRLVSCSNGRHHGLDAKDVEGPSQIVDERREAELSPDIVEALHQKGALVHPLLDAAEGMLDELATPVEDFRPRLAAFQRSTHNNYEWETLFVYLPQFDQGDSKSGKEVEIRCIPRWPNQYQLRMPRWTDDPGQCFKRGLVPLSLLRPGDIDIATEIDLWLRDATKHWNRPTLGSHVLPTILTTRLL